MTRDSREIQSDFGYDAAPPPGVLGLRLLQQKLHISSKQSVTVINAPAESGLRLLTAVSRNPERADVVVGFATRPVDLAWLRPAYAAAHAGRLAWISYPKPGRPGTELRRDWLVRAFRQYGIETVQEVSIDLDWSALRLRPANDYRQPDTPAAD